MINITIDNMSAFYLTMAIIALGFSIVVAFGRTEKRHRK